MSRVHLITRPLFEAESLAAELKKQGVDSLLCPLTKIVWAEDNVPPARRLPPEKIDALLATSANGLRGLDKMGAGAATAVAGAVAALRDKRIFVVGAATAQSAHALGFSKVEVAAGDSDSLISLIKQEQARGSHLLYLTGTPHSRDFAAALPDYRLSQLELYCAESLKALPAAIEAALSAHAISSVSFFSLRAATIFKALTTDFSFSHASAFCLSAAIAKELSPINFSAIIVGAPDKLPLLIGARG